MLPGNCCNSSTTDCVNPLIALFKKAQGLVTTEVTIGAAITTVLTDGIVMTHNGKYCCPDCDARFGYYYLGGRVPHLQIAALMNQVPAEVFVKYPCCLNSSFTASNQALFSADFEGAEVPCCESDFSESVDLVSEITGDTVGDLIEASTFGGQSGLGILLQYLQLEEVSAADILLIFEAIVATGVVIKCFECDIFIGSPTAFDSIGATLNLIPN